MPGPTGKLGTERAPYVDTVEGAESEDVAPDRPSPRIRKSKAGPKVAKAAVKYIGARRIDVNGERQRYDCSGFVCAAHKRAGVELNGNTASLYERARRQRLLHKRKLPMLGDVAFFDNTYDRNRNGKRDDKLSHVAIVERVDGDGTITLVHKGSKGIRRITMNLQRPHDKVDADGQKLNSVLGVHKKGSVLAGELWCGFGSMWAVDTDQMAQN